MGNFNKSSSSTPALKILGEKQVPFRLATFPWKDKDAEEVYRKAIKADPKYPSTYYNFGLLYEECLHDATKAVAAYDKYIDLRGEKYEEVQERVKRLREMGKSQPK